ncbi:uncharacterized protein LOC117106294 [Anneissia japonica]|uniref:uncharacterized protein LOC117106294 n=1 Tax=Anneissia japonica TaxID=1529436 RepID=UPI0014255793|nr:uncharacterized protein LOC117106294 [Anneissia japonica]
MQVWKRKRQNIMDEIRTLGAPVVLGGDARADSVGHCAKYGSYTLMDLNRNKVIDIQLVQKNVVGGSYHMELEGLKLGVAAIGMEQLKIQALVTDRHAQVAKWIRENLKDIQHYYDVWHVAKSLGKRVRAIGKEKDCEVVQEWARSINNHVYWVASSTPSGDRCV